MLSIDNSEIRDYCKKTDNTLAAKVSFSFSGASAYTTAPDVTFTGGGGTGAAGTATIENGRVTGVTITSPGTGYTTAPVIGFVGGGGSGAEATAVTNGDGITAVNVVDGGDGQEFTFTDATTYATGDSRSNVNISVFDRFGNRAEVQIPSDSATATLPLSAGMPKAIDRTEGVSMIATVVSIKGKVKDGSVHNTFVDAGNFTMEA
jgi:hypothetical protein